MKGVYVSMSDGDTASYSVTLDAAGKETSREQLTPPSRGGGGGAAAAGGGAGRAGAGAPAPLSNARASPPPPAAPPAAGGAGRATAPAAPPARGTQLGSAARGRPTLKMNDWNETYIAIGTDGPPAGTQVGPIKVVSTYGPAQFVVADEKNATGYGNVALYVGGTGEVRYKDVAWKDHERRRADGRGRHRASHIRRVNELYYGWSARRRPTSTATARGHHLRTVLLPRTVLHRAPDLPRRPRLQPGDRVRARHGQPHRTTSRATGGRTSSRRRSAVGTIDLYVNPKGESRRWDTFTVLPTIRSEIVLMKDLDGDGKPEMIFGMGPTATAGRSRIRRIRPRTGSAPISARRADSQHPRPRRRRRQRRRARRHRRADGLVRTASRAASVTPVDVPRPSSRRSARRAARWACTTSTATG